MTNPPVFTLLIACKNEERDICLAIESSLAQRYSHREILCVDDSTDGTKAVIRSYADWGVRLIDGPGQGCCIARNIGIQRAAGDIIVFLTADTCLEPDYLEKILPYYQQGYDWVTVESKSFNLESVYSRFVEMQHRHDESKDSYDPFTTQGYSVKRSAALAVGLIDGGVYPFNTCRDWTLGKKLSEHGYKKMFDRSIIVPHKSPDTFAEYWQVRTTRGRFAAYQPHYLFSQPLWALAVKFSAKDLIALAQFVMVAPLAWRVFQIARCSPRPFVDFFLFYYAYSVQLLARCLGEWQAWLHIVQARRRGICT